MSEEYLFPDGHFISLFNSYYGDVKVFEKYVREQGIPSVLANISEKVVRDFLHEMGKTKASATVRRYHGTISRMYKRLEREGIRNITIDIDLPPLHHQPGRYLTYEECTDILAFADELREQEGKDTRLTVRYMLYTGLRNAALQQCMVSYVDLKQGLLRIPPEINKRSEPQLLPLPDKLLVETEQFIVSNRLGNEDRLLPGLSGKALHCRQLNRITERINHYFDWKGEQRVSPHVFRATLSTLLDDMGICGDIIDFILNHHPPSVREKHYTRSMARKIRESKLALNTFEAKVEGMYEKKKRQEPMYMTRPAESSASATDQSMPLEQMLTKALSDLIQSNPQLLLSVARQWAQPPEKKQ